MVMVVTFFLHHSLKLFFRIGLHKGHKAYRLRPLLISFDGIQYIFHPHVIFAAHIDEKITVLNLLDILRGRLVGMHLFTRFEQHSHVRTVPCYVSGKIILGKNRSHDLQTGILFCLGCGSSGSDAIYFFL